MAVEMLVNIDVDDLDTAISFYQRAFGLSVGRRFGASGVELTGAGSLLYLLVKQEGTRATKATEQMRTYARHWTPVHLDFVVQDADAAVARAVAAGAIQEGTTETNPWGRIAHFSDPFGHGFCVLQFLGRGYDEISDAREPGDAPAT
jgi:predicted enzyme related to lactoylglutathione lyase